MKYPFSMVGRIVVVDKYTVTAKTDTFRVPTEEDAKTIAEHFGGTVEAIDPSTYAGVLWMDGIEVADVPDTYAEAVKIYEMGEDAYKVQQELAVKCRNEQLRADLDYVILMGGL